jgi:hypothetical protein
MFGRTAENSTKWGCEQGSLVGHERVAQYILGASGGLLSL